MPRFQFKELCMPMYAIPPTVYEPIHTGLTYCILLPIGSVQYRLWHVQCQVTKWFACTKYLSVNRLKLLHYSSKSDESKNIATKIYE